MSKPLTIRELTTIEALASVMFAEQIAQVLGRPVDFVLRAAKSNKVRVKAIPKRCGKLRLRTFRGKDYLYLERKRKQRSFACYLYEHFSGTKIPKGYNLRFKDGNTMNARFDNLELYPKRDILIKTAFETGHVPFNKGTKGYMKANATSFKRGSEPHNTKHDGAISIRQKQGEKPYKYIRVGASKWMLLHRHIWEQANGPIPSDSLVTFVDGDTMNCELSNLNLITKAENAKRNSNREKAAESMRWRWKVRKAKAKITQEFPDIFQ